MAPTYKLRYFNVTGVGEPIRYLLNYGKIEFEDDRIEYPDFPALKPELPFGQVPIFEVDGKTVWQSTAICRYVAKKVGLAGKDDWETLLIDCIADTITDFRLHYAAFFREEDPKLKAEKYEKCLKTHNPYYFSRFEKILKENNGFLVNGKLTWADVYFAALVGMFMNIVKEPLIDDYPGIQKLKEHVENLPGIKEYIANRPETIL